ncbi:MAG: hypothetical protein NC043_02945 [Muribaculaceae bacterium]|nr:hypothetical protein [Muribaculaceae bacterium]
MKGLKHIIVVLIATVVSVVVRAEVPELVDISVLRPGTVNQIETTHTLQLKDGFTIEFELSEGKYYMKSGDLKIEVDRLGSILLTRPDFVMKVLDDRYSADNMELSIDSQSHPEIGIYFFNNHYEKPINLISELPDWISFDSGNNKLSVKANESGLTREAEIVFGLDGYSATKTLSIIQDASAFFTDEMQSPDMRFLNHRTDEEWRQWVQPQGDVLTYNFKKGTSAKCTEKEAWTIEVLDDSEYGNFDYSMFRPQDINIEFDEENGTFDVIVAENPYEREREFRATIQMGSQLYKLFIAQPRKGLPTYEQQRKAVAGLYNSTNGKNWRNNTNWLTNEDMSQWYGLSVHGKYLTGIDLSNNNLIGAVNSDDLEVLIRTPRSFSILGNGLYGILSDNLQQLGEWQTRGINVLTQSPFFSGKQRFSNYKRNIRIDNVDCTSLWDDSTIKFYDIVGKNDLTWIGVSSPSEYVLNQQLSYPGVFGSIAYNIPVFESQESMITRYGNYKYKDYTTYLIDKEGGDGLSFILPLGRLGTTVLVDTEGYLVDLFPKDWSIPDDFENTITDNILNKESSLLTPIHP